MPDLLAAADLVVLTSRWEARSLVAQEALLLGCRLVASAVGGLPKLLGDSARLVPARDVDALGWPTPDDTATQVAAAYQELTGVAG